MLNGPFISQINSATTSFFHHQLISGLFVFGLRSASEVSNVEFVQLEVLMEACENLQQPELKILTRPSSS